MSGRIGGHSQSRSGEVGVSQLVDLIALSQAAMIVNWMHSSRLHYQLRLQTTMQGQAVPDLPRSVSTLASWCCRRGFWAGLAALPTQNYHNTSLSSHAVSRRPFAQLLWSSARFLLFSSLDTLWFNVFGIASLLLVDVIFTNSTLLTNFSCIYSQKMLFQCWLNTVHLLILVGIKSIKHRIQLYNQHTMFLSHMKWFHDT